MTEDNEEMSMLFSFPDQSDSFTLGFGAGIIWQRIESGERVIDMGFEDGMPAHQDNMEVIVRMANCYGYEVEHKPPVDGWCGVRLTLKTKPTARLRVVGEQDD